MGKLLAYDAEPPMSGELQHPDLARAARRTDEREDAGRGVAVEIDRVLREEREFAIGAKRPEIQLATQFAEQPPDGSGESGEHEQHVVTCLMFTLAISIYTSAQYRHDLEVARPRGEGREEVEIRILQERKSTDEGTMDNRVVLRAEKRGVQSVLHDQSTSRSRPTVN